MKPSIPNLKPNSDSIFMKKAKLQICNTFEKDKYDGNACNRTNEVLMFESFPDQKEVYPNIELKTNIAETNNKPPMDEDSSSQDVSTKHCLK